MDILTDTNYDFNVWYNTKDPDFIDICARSKVPEKWVSYGMVMSGDYSDSVIKPINSYAQNLYPAPKLIKIDGNTVTIRQHSHAEILLLEEDGNLKALDRPWVRQFYNSSHERMPVDGCFTDPFVLYVPWFIDESVSVYISESPDSPIRVYDKHHRYEPVGEEEHFVNPVMVPFRFKNTGDHMQSKSVGKVKRGSPLFDMSFHANDIIIERVRKFYEKIN